MQTRDMRTTMKPLVNGQAVTYTVCGGDDDRTGDERQTIIHADLECGFPAKTAREPETLSMGCKVLRHRHVGPLWALLTTTLWTVVSSPGA